jgi:Na+/proline symporter
MATQLNWGASYIVNDVYKRFMRRDATESHYINVGRVTTVFLFLAALVVTRHLTTVEGAWKFLIAIGAGTGLVLILRWYWWRINAWSEVSAMVASFATSLVALRVIPGRFAAGDPRADSWVLLVTVAVSTVVWVSVTFLTVPENDAVLERFYRQVRPGGSGWARVSERIGFGREPIPGGVMQWTNWIAGVVAIYCSLFGIGRLVFGQWVSALVVLGVAGAAFAWIARSLSQPEAPAGAV